MVRRRIVAAKDTEWSIGIYGGASPYDLAPLKDVSYPVLSARDVTDIKAEFVADPFMIRHASKWYMFFEVLNALTNRGEIGLATSDDGLRWRYERIVLREPFHLSYPYVFRYRDDFTWFLSLSRRIRLPSMSLLPSLISGSQLAP